MAKLQPLNDNFYVLDESLASDVQSVSKVKLKQWLAENNSALLSPLPLGLAITGDALKQVSPTILDALQVASIPVTVCDTKLDSETFINWLLCANSNAMTALHSARAGNAATRRSHDALQSNFVEVEEWLHLLQSPKFICLREIAPVEAVIEVAAGEELVQPLPVSSRGIVATDLWLSEGGTLPNLVLVSRSGTELGRLTSDGAADKSGAVRFHLDSALAGPPYDVDLRIQNLSKSSIKIRLGEATVNTAFHAQYVHAECKAPIATRIWAGLPGVRGPKIAEEPPGQRDIAKLIMPAEIDDIAVVSGRFVSHPSLGAIELRPEKDGRGLLVIRGLPNDRVNEISANFQLFGDSGAAVTLCAVPTGEISAANQAYRLPVGRYVAPSQYTILTCDISESDFDLIVRIEQAVPGTALWIWALKLVLHCDH